MKYIAVPGLELGCSQIVVGTSPFSFKKSDEIFELLDSYLENGGNTLDTAGIYSNGTSEQVLAMWLQSRRCRDNINIVSKCCHHYIDDSGRHHPDKQRVRPEFIIEDLSKSLNNMKVDYFDICLLHRDDMAVPVAELMDALEEQKDSGLIKAYGVSNWSIGRIAEAARYCAAKGYAGISLNSPSLSLAKVNEPRWTGCVYADHDYIAWHRHTQLAMLSWAAQASGFFSGRYSRDRIVNTEVARVYYNDESLERLRRAEVLAQQKGNWVSANHIALAYVLCQTFPICAVIGPQTTAELKDSLRAVEIPLSKQERHWLEVSG